MSSPEKMDSIVSNVLGKFLAEYNLKSFKTNAGYTIYGKALDCPIELALMYDLPTKPYSVRTDSFSSEETVRKAKELDAILARQLNLELLKIIRWNWSTI